MSMSRDRKRVLPERIIVARSGESWQEWLSAGLLAVAPAASLAVLKLEISIFINMLQDLSHNKNNPHRRCRC